MGEHHAELQEALTALTMTRVERNSLLEELREMRLDLEGSRNLVAMMRDVASQHQKNAETLGERLNAAERKIRAQENELRMAHDAYQNLDKANAELNAARKHVPFLYGQVDDLFTKLDAARGIAVGAEQEKRNIERQYEGLKAACASCERHNSQLQHRVNELEAKIEDEAYAKEAAEEREYETKKIVDALVSLARRIV